MALRHVVGARGSQPARTREPVTICPNPDIGYFDREYTLFEMMRHLYGTGPCLTPKDKPSAFDVEKLILKKLSNVLINKINLCIIVCKINITNFVFIDNVKFIV
jgi:hypothetical protein